MSSVRLWTGDGRGRWDGLPRDASKAFFALCVRAPSRSAAPRSPRSLLTEMSAGYVSLNLLSNNATLISIGESTNSFHWIMTNTNLQKLKKGCHYSQTFVSKDQHYNLNRFPMHKVCINYGFKISEVQEKTTLRLAGWVEILDTTLYKQASPLCRLSI